MYPSPLKLFCALSIFFFIPSISTPFLPANNVSLFGDAFLNNNYISLTKEKNCTSPSPPPPPLLYKPSITAPSGVGRVFYVNPVRFSDPSANSTVSFSCSFSFNITNAPSCPFGDGFAFLITSNISSFSRYDGYMGLPGEIQDSYSVQDSYLAVEFDTSFDPNLEDVNGNHIGIDVNKIRSLASIDVLSRGEIDLKDGKEITAWIEYRDSEKMIRVWVGYSKQIRPQTPVLDLQIDLSKQFKEFMHVGFTASNGKGSSSHTINRWRFKTFSGFMPMDPHEAGNCLICSPGDTDIEFGFDYPEFSGRALHLALVLGAFVAVLILIAAVVLVFVFVMRRRRRRLRNVRSERQMRRFQGGRMIPKMLSLTEIKSATNGFDQDKIVGTGASAVVYEGTIPNCGAVAVKRFNHENKFNPSISHGPFNTEFATMAGCLRHKNLVQLQGWCCEGSELVLVYEYMANGSLDKILHDGTNLTKFLTWERRLNIVLGVASALIYLHEECESQIIHRDVKTCNILLDAEFNPKLGDFGLAEVYRHSYGTRDATVPAGTMGYLAPEYAFSGVPTVKTDVYSFGVVILEVASGRRPIDEERVVITDYVWDLWEKGIITEAADRKLMGRFNRIEMEKMLMVGLSCAHPNCEKRPRMREAARMLRGESPLPVLPSRKPIVKIQSVLPEGCEEIMSFGGGECVDDTPWSTPRTHFSKN
ncbi:Serine/threonine protein kinase [Handroanthus impetiginosus]|uniref:non-specific serine/threonine protein kinase n=1 Tax=Handroanthus impetiginosus TaxID=429701 RepID=A0A2G9I082_9LAMI|nr:Serine/threonine protein kinase [Handroanthus impetiginosus]